MLVLNIFNQQDEKYIWEVAEQKILENTEH